MGKPFRVDDETEARRYIADGHRVQSYTYHVPGLGPIRAGRTKGVAITRWIVWPKDQPVSSSAPSLSAEGVTE